MNSARSAWRLARRLAAAGLLASGLGVAVAQTQTDASLTGTLAKVRNAGAVTIGYRESSIPFSYLSARKEPIGYSIELCKQLVDAIGDAVHKTLAIKWVPVTPASRIDAVANGQVDLECGSTTSNLERQKRVAFSPTLFVSGTKLLVKKGSPVKTFRDLAGKTVAVTAGTTNEKTMKDLSERFKLGLNIVVSADHAESFGLVKAGKAEAFATDDVLLYGFIAEDKAASQGQSAYEVVGDFLSYDPYGVMYRKDDPQMARVVNETFQMLAQDGEIERQYKRWFLRKLPSGTSIDLPMSPQLETILQTMAVKSE
ncbi:amino acid ABC transporter substrate-binding protein [Variovorax sp. J22G21]|uniref:amino acid ABC transporter substrate-binding protein n=1 Tax=Variovorax fucosicus TaxID=3053517 RepID=UPI002575ED57|nr:MULTISPECIES: amino acid ABC transporter substrate-binding protein [unclassified Variovorax]MDM0038175.1 amino acid ABC transporter substrate-binding protein [Variovorax sp. J22R193]MDM0062951.1 amino acid ABC transporter substrate-binding protein [Variovorax sp. J22G21]